MNGAIKQIKNGRANLQYLVHMVTRYSYFINVNVINQVVDRILLLDELHTRTHLCASMHAYIHIFALCVGLSM